MIYPFPWTRGNFGDSLRSGYDAWLFASPDEPAVPILGYAVLMRAVDEVHLLNISVVAARQGRGHGRRILKSGAAQQALFTVNIPSHINAQAVVDRMLNDSAQTEIVSTRSFDGITSIVFRTQNLDYKMNFSLQQRILSLDPGIQINVFYPDSTLGNSSL